MYGTFCLFAVRMTIAKLCGRPDWFTPAILFKDFQESLLTIPVPVMWSGYGSSVFMHFFWEMLWVFTDKMYGIRVCICLSENIGNNFFSLKGNYDTSDNSFMWVRMYPIETSWNSSVILFYCHSWVLNYIILHLTFLSLIY